ncbi:hypothetical protein AB0J86_30250 [Micromonospora sp. NPDC049559]|uniref:hypothetical protein n=1 Tax=Micromonospora sp. NPDC049559 TaxID=3155923 RepID=UPI003424C7F7
MRFSLSRAATAALLLTSAVALPADPAGAATAGPSVDTTAPAVVGAGQNPIDVPVRVVNTGGTDHLARLRLTVTPVAGSATRPLAATLVLTYEFGVQQRQMSYETRGDTLVATTPDLLTVRADETTTIRLRVATRPTSTAPHVDEVTALVDAEALDSSTGAVFATDPEPDRMTMVEPRAELAGWPERLPVGTPAVVTATLTNTTPLPYPLLRPALAMFRASDASEVVVERLDGAQWTRVAGPSNGYYWFYAVGYPSLQPGDAYTATLRITFTDDAAVGEQGFVYQIGYNYFGTASVAADLHPYTITPRA